jgi:hypothetical protein
VEGAALIVLRGAKNALANGIIRRIKIEIESEKQIPPLIKLLKRFSYKIFLGKTSLFAFYSN